MVENEHCQQPKTTLYEIRVTQKMKSAAQGRAANTWLSKMAVAVRKRNVTSQSSIFA
jgi:hypothetical protein